MTVRLDELRKQARTTGRRAADRAASDVENTLKRKAPKGKTRELERSIQARVTSETPTGFTVTATAGGPGVIQADTTEKGAKPHIIRPRKRGGVLVFPMHGKTVFARKVNHPGNPPMPWFAPTVQQWPQIVARAWKQAV